MTAKISELEDGLRESTKKNTSLEIQAMTGYNEGLDEGFLLFAKIL